MRVAYHDTKLTDDQIRQLRDLTTFDGITLELFQGKTDLDRLHHFAVGTRIKNDLPRIGALSSKIFRPNEYQKNEHRYGFSLEGGGMSGPMMYSRFQLAAATMGFAMQPMSQVLDEFPEMREQYAAVHKAYAPQGGTCERSSRAALTTAPFDLGIR